MPDSPSGNNNSYSHLYFGSSASPSWTPPLPQLPARGPPKQQQPDSYFSRTEFGGFPSQQAYSHHNHYLHHPPPPPEFYTSMPSRSEFGTTASNEQRFPGDNNNSRFTDAAKTQAQAQQQRPSFDLMESRSQQLQVLEGGGGGGIRSNPTVSTLSHQQHPPPPVLYDYHNNSNAYPGQFIPPPPPGPIYSYYNHQQHHHPAAAAAAHHHHQQEPPWPMVSPPSYNVASMVAVAVEYISELGPDDVLSGRGGATNSYKGNRAFRTLVKEYQEKYLQAKKRDKPAVASIIVELIRKRGGRFLQRYCTTSSSNNNRDNHNNNKMVVMTGSNGHVLWTDIGDDRAREKTCQALREGAPEIRRNNRKGGNKGTASTTASRSSSYDDDDEAEEEVAPYNNRGRQQQRPGSTCSSSEAKDNTDATLSSPSTMERGNSRGGSGGGDTARGAQLRARSSDEPEDDSDMDDHTPEVRNGNKKNKAHRRRRRVDHRQDAGNDFDDDDDDDNDDEAPIRIRPWARLIPDRPPVEPIGLDQLSAQDRDIYLRDFLPPCPRSELSQQQQQRQQQLYAQHQLPTTVGQNNTNSNNLSPSIAYEKHYDNYHSPDQDSKLPARKTASWPLLTA